MMLPEELLGKIERRPELVQSSAVGGNSFNLHQNDDAQFFDVANVFCFQRIVLKMSTPMVDVVGHGCRASSSTVVPRLLPPTAKRSVHSDTGMGLQD